MTVLEDHIMSNSLGGDRYITPEYLAPLPQKDGVSGKSPLELLAQTCSQIGTEQNSKPLDKGSKGNSQLGEKGTKSVPKSSSPAIIVSDSQPVSFKPYENTKDISVINVESKISIASTRDNNNKSTPSISSSPEPNGSQKRSSDIMITSENKGISNESNKQQRSGSANSETKPTLSSGMDILSASAKDFGLGVNRPPGFFSGLDASNPAYRHPFGGPPGYPQPSSVSGGVCRDPYCKDPTCPTAVYNAYAAHLSAASRGLQPGYLELLEAQKMLAQGMGGSQPPISSPAPIGPAGPYICNWMNGRDYCGKRFTSAEELLIHLKTHTNSSVSETSFLNSPFSSPFSNPNTMSLLRGAVGSAGPVLPSSLALHPGRFSPYQRPGAPLPPSLGGLGAGLPQSLAGIPPTFSSLAGYPASLYALYGGRL